jgi:putative chitinase
MLLTLNDLDDTLLYKMFPNAGSRLTPHLPYIVPAMQEFEIDNPHRIVGFLAQLAHESSEYRYMEEIADGSEYEGRTDLGDVYPGDGRKYKGHGPIQITGRTNYKLCGAALGIDLINQPTLITLPQYGTLSAAWFWSTHDLNYVADQDWFLTITHIINGGYTGLDDRISYWNKDRSVVGLPYLDILNREKSLIAAYQSKNGLVADGDCGPNTIRKLKGL